jgi:DNA polymerase-3 subunit delta
MDLRLNQLAAHLERTFALIYLVHGDEPLLALEAGDAIRTAARKAGCDEREVLIAESGFAWEALTATNANLSLFGERKLIELRIPSGKPGIEGAKVLERCAAHPNPGRCCSSRCRGRSGHAIVRVVLLARRRWCRDRRIRSNATNCRRGSPRGSRDSSNASHAKRWRFLPIAARATRSRPARRLRSSGLLLPEGELAHDAVSAAVGDVARYDVFELSEAWLAGDAGRAVRIIAALQAEGEGVGLLLWQLGEDLHALASVLAATASGVPATSAIRGARVWGKRQGAMERAARRVTPTALIPMLRALARLDAMSKGIGRGNVWDELRAAALVLAGKPATPLAGAYPGH